MSKPFYITTPIYYINDVPHIGHAYTSIAVDMIARFHKIAGREVFLLTGTDEHGNKVAEAAAAAGMTEIDYCDKIVVSFQDVLKKLDIENDYFIRTTSERHKKAVWKILDAMRAAKTDDGQDVVYSADYEGLYCTGCEKFITEKELVDGLCPDHKVKPDALKEKNYFFRLSAFLPKIKKLIETDELRILPVERKREVLGLINQDIPDFSLSRERVKWGTPLSFDKDQVAYVWVDALSNYISAIGYGDDEKTFNKWWNDGEVVHLLAKDILKFHALWWPAMLLAAGMKLPSTMFIHGFFTVDGEKMSKTLGNTIDPNEIVEQFGIDGARYLLLTQFPFGVDGDVQAKRFATKYNSDLANDLGNLVSRVAKMILVNFDGKIPSPNRAAKEIIELMEQTEPVPNSVYAHINHFRLSKAIDEAIDLVRFTNKYFNDKAPWKLVKDGNLEEAGGVLYACAEVIRIVSIVLFPIMPNKMREIRKVFSLDDSTITLESANTFFDLKPGTSVQIKDSVFPRIDTKAIEKKKKESAKQNDDNLIDIADFAKVKLLVAEVLEAEKVEGADRLLKLQVNVGAETRQVVAGVAEYYPPDKIKGMKVIMVANLKPAVIRGIESNGMLLAAKKGKKLTLLSPSDDLPAGAKVS